MPEITLKFSDEEKTDALRAMRATSCLCALSDFSQYLRGLYKYGEHSPEVSAMVSEIRDRFYAECGEFLNDLE